MIDVNDSRFVTGTPEERERARAEFRRERFTAQVMASPKLEEIPRANLQPVLRGLLEDDRNGAFYRVRQDGLVDLDFARSAVAYFIDPTGLPVLLEPPSGMGVKNRTELEQRQADREARRNAPVRRRTRERRQ